MAEKEIPGGVLLGISVFGVIVALYSATKVEAAKQIPLYAGSNEVIYAGKRQTAEKAFISIRDYVVIAHYYDELTEQWIEITDDMILEPGMLLDIEVIHDCIWIL